MKMAPWKDFNGNGIFEGDKIRHPSGKIGFVFYQARSARNESDNWLVQYDSGPASPLCLQIGDKGQAVKMKNYCNGCTTCCQWGGDLKAQVLLLPQEKSRYLVNPKHPNKLKTTDNGDCVYLDRLKGCTIHIMSPINCKTFDCRELLDTVMQNKDNVFLRTLMEAVRIKLFEALIQPGKAN